MTSTATAEQLAERIFDGAIVSMEQLSISLGVQLGLYQALASGDRHARQLAEAAGIHPRYAREWLEQQAVAGILTVAEDNADPYQRTFSLPPAYRSVLLDADHPLFLATLPGFIASFAQVLPQLAVAFRTGEGVAYEAYGALTRHGIAGMNQPMYRNDLAGWIATLPDIEKRLQTGGAVLDLGCGTGGSSIALARLFGRVRVHGVDLDAASVAEANEQVGASGLSGRVSFTQADAASLPPPAELYDLVCVFESLHDMADPVGVLRAVRSQLSPGGAVLIADERVAEHFGAPGDQVERLNYSFSVLHCLPATRAEGTSVEAGTVLRPDTVREYAAQAGYAGCTVLPIENDLWRFYRLDPA